MGATALTFTSGVFAGKANNDATDEGTYSVTVTASDGTDTVN